MFPQNFMILLSMVFESQVHKFPIVLVGNNALQSWFPAFMSKFGIHWILWLCDSFCWINGGGDSEFSRIYLVKNNLFTLFSYFYGMLDLQLGLAFELEFWYQKLGWKCMSLLGCKCNVGCNGFVHGHEFFGKPSKK